MIFGDREQGKVVGVTVEGLFVCLARVGTLGIEPVYGRMCGHE